MATLSIKISDGVTSKTLTFNEGSSEVTKSAVNAFIDKYNAAYESETTFAAAFYQPTVPKIQLFAE